VVIPSEAVVIPSIARDLPEVLAFPLRTCLLCAGLLLPQPVSLSGQGVAAGVARTLRLADGKRSYRLRIPYYYRPENPAPLLLVFHGAGGGPSSIARHTAFDSLAQSAGWIIVYPQGARGRWNDGRDHGPGSDDVEFIRALLDTLQDQLALDPERIYATGISNGAMFTYRLACDLPGVLAAIAPVAGAMPAELAKHCSSPRPVSVLAFQGTADPLMPYAGGGVARRRGQVLSAERSVAFWARAAGCAAPPRAVAEPDSVDDGTRVRRLTYAGCKGGHDVALYAIEGGGHTWPGGAAAGQRVGRVSREVDATRTMWDFFQQHPRQ
jgi:polyhydroxybutyrate depolymerase